MSTALSSPQRASALVAGRVEGVLRVLHYNILDGFEKDAARIDAFIGWIETAAPDVLSLNEYREGDAGLRRRLAGAGYVHAAVNTAFPAANRCAVFSRLPLAERETSADFRFLRVRIGGLDLVAYHASPGGVAAVLAEAERLLPRLQGRRDVVVAGDFNSLSPADRDRFGHDHPAHPVCERYLRAGAVSYELIDRLAGAGLRDLDATPAEAAPEARATVPTAIARRHEGGLLARLDYAFGRLESFDARSHVLRGPPFDRLSDHFPVLIALGPKRVQETPRENAAAWPSEPGQAARLQTPVPLFYPAPGHPGGRRGMRIVAHNVFWFQGSGFATDAPPAPRAEILERLCALYRELRADVLCLQEIQSEAVAREVARLLDMDYRYRAGGGYPHYGGAVFSRWPLAEKPLAAGLVPDRVLLPIRVCREGARPLDLMNIHLPSGRQRGAEGGRWQRLRELAAVAGQADLLLGDFNERPDGPCAAFLGERDYADVAPACAAGELPNHPSGAGFRGDQIWLSRRRLRDLLGYFSVPGPRLALDGAEKTFLSDHLPIGCELIDP